MLNFYVKFYKKYDRNMNMNTKLTFLATLMVIFPIFTSADVSQQHKLATIVLGAETASYMVRNDDNGVYVTTFGYKTPTETCELLKSKGINVIHVTDYTKHKDGRNSGIILEKNC